VSFPTNNVHRRNRRALGKGQSVSAPTVATTVTGAGSTVTLTFASPINVAGILPVTVATLALTTQTVVSPTVVTQLMSGALATHAWNVPSPLPNASTYNGGAVVGGSGTF